MSPTEHLLMITFRIWLGEIPLAALNAFVLMDRVYAPRVGAVGAHRRAMATRMAYIPVLAYLLAHFAGTYTWRSLVLGGLFWMGLWLAFEWVGSLLLRRPVAEILVGWHVEHGYLWPYVLLVYLVAPVVVGTVLHP